MNFRRVILFTFTCMIWCLRGFTGTVDPLAIHPGPWSGSAVIIRGDFDATGLGSRGVVFHSVLPGLSTARLPKGDISRILMFPGVEYIEASVSLEPLLDIATSDSVIYPDLPIRRYLGTAADGAQDVGWDGRGVLIGVIDAGFDLDHPDFKDSTGSTRILFLWDQTVSDNPPPDPFGYGSLWTAEEINDGSCTQVGHIHGTRVLGIAAGNGGGLPDQRYAGVAPNAGLILVKSTLMTTELIDGMYWMTQMASFLELPLSVSLSLGSHYGAHDGSRGDEHAINTLASLGVSFSCAAGNSDSFPIHDSGDVYSAGQRDTIPVFMGDYPQSGTEKGFGIDLWYDAGCSLAISLEDPGNSMYGSVTMGDSLRIDSPSGLIWIGNALDDPPNGDDHGVLFVTDGGTADSVSHGTWNIYLHWDAVSPFNGGWHAWIFFRSHGACRFTNPDSTCTLIMPATAESCLTSGGYLRDDGNAYRYSSRGPTRDGRLKPELTAPTNVFTSDLGGGYTRFSGTSATAPHLAGAIALYFQRQPDARPADLRELLVTSVRTDGAVLSAGSVPNDKWGFGKLYCEPMVRPFCINDISVFADTTFTLSWDASAGAHTYEIYADTLAWFSPDTLGFFNLVDSLTVPFDQDPSNPGIQWIDPAESGAVIGGLRSYIIRAIKGAETWWSENRSAGFGVETTLLRSDYYRKQG